MKDYLFVGGPWHGTFKAISRQNMPEFRVLGSRGETYTYRLQSVSISNVPGGLRDAFVLLGGDAEENIEKAFSLLFTREELAFWRSAQFGLDRIMERDRVAHCKAAEAVLDTPYRFPYEGTLKARIFKWLGFDKLFELEMRVKLDYLKREILHRQPPKAEELSQ